MLLHVCMSRLFITSEEAYKVTVRNLEKPAMIFTNCLTQASVSTSILSKQEDMCTPLMAKYFTGQGRNKGVLLDSPSLTLLKVQISGQMGLKKQLYVL